MPASQKSKRTRRQLLVGLIATVLLVACVGLATLAQGKVSGTEFLPDDFRQRSFEFWEIPLVHKQISPIRRSGSVNSLASYLTANAMIEQPLLPSQRAVESPSEENWHLVSLSRGSLARPAGDAELLVDFLNDDSGKTWRQWTVDHPAQAKVFWPLIQRLAKRELYVLMPDLFSIARPAPPPDTLQQQLDQYVADSYLAIANDMHDAEKLDIARGLALEAASDYPQDSRFTELLARLPANDMLPEPRTDTK